MLVVLPNVLNKLRAVCILCKNGNVVDDQRWKRGDLTVPRLKHVMDEEVVEADLRFWDGAR